MFARTHPGTFCFLSIIYLKYPKLPGGQGHSVISLPSRNSYLGEEYTVCCDKNVSCIFQKELAIAQKKADW